MRILKTFLKILLALFLVGLVLAVIAYIVVFKVLPGKDPSHIFNRAAISEVLSGESRVYYRDGKTVLGAFFDVNHRIYVPYGDIPENVINALVAAEDARYWNHQGFDFRGFSRAMFNNLRMGRLRQGGSSLTQQTVKNIFGREENSVKEKWKELMNALRMEKHFSKEDILEFYLNQFHVSGTGKGVAIAAQYFFNKDLNNLTLAECAFIAGSVKGPFNYDPFIQRTTARRDSAIARGEHRTRYVLRRMVEEKYISQAEMDSALAKPLPFEHGNFRFTLSTPLANLEEKLDSKFYQDFFTAQDIPDWRRSQLEVSLNLDAEYQDAAMRALQNNISKLQVQLGGFALPKAEFPNRALKARKGDYLYGAVDTAAYDSLGKLESIFLSFGQLHGVVTSGQLKKFGESVKGDPAKILASRLGKGSVLLVSILDTVPVSGNRYPCRIETEPVLQGALVSIQEGRVLASQSGFHNTGFDRSFKALRQFGSSWKPLLFALALNYHWNYLDEIENDFNLFQYGNQFYFPRPDHMNKGETVSILWAAVRSENIASVWLLDHLFDKLSLEEWEEVMQKNGYAQTPEEDRKAYFERLRDQYGLMLRGSAEQEIEFTKAQNELVQKLIYENEPLKARTLRNMFYGNNVSAGIKAQAKNKENLQKLNHNYLHYMDLLKKSLVETPGMGESSSDAAEIAPHFTLADFKRLVSMVETADESKNYLEPASLRNWRDFNRSLAMADFARFLKQIGIREPLQQVQSMPLGVNDVTLAEMTTAYQSILSGKVYRCKDGEWNEPCWIQKIKNRDGKVIFENETEEEKILSDTVTSQMAVMLRMVFTHGTARSQVNALSLKSEDGKETLRFPALGKTGTTNDYRNVAFLGALPTYVPDKNGYSLDSVIAIGSYVGFDDNRPLRSGRTRIAGASGGLPQWVDFAEEVLGDRRENANVDFLDLSSIARGEAPFHLGNERGEIPVHPETGLPLASAGKSVMVPWLDIPDFVPPSVTSAAATEASSAGFITSLTLPQVPDSLQAASSVSEKEERQSEENDWELPADFSGENAFVPIEPE
ncbi:MAG: transglycosylase domain-containing protein [Fibrobacter sp.]|jgi:membrane peptidoglycan carboxypeptidase|nr:transglycosylase domain-containing protein [Fibrobacter sp.]